MFHIIIHFHMTDTVDMRHDNPSAVIAALKMSTVRHIEITSTKGD